MAGEEIAVIELQDKFYRDSIGRLVFAYIGIAIGICVMVGIGIYLYLDKPPPVIFPVDNELRVQPLVPVSQPYLSDAEVIQWLADILPKALVFDFIYYETQLSDAKKYFTNNGWTAFSNQLNIFANQNIILENKLFVTARVTSTPWQDDHGIIEDSGKYGWWLQIPLAFKYDGYKPLLEKTVTFKVLVVRVPTLNNLVGVAIENIFQAPETPQTGQP